MSLHEVDQSSVVAALRLLVWPRENLPPSFGLSKFNIASAEACTVIAHQARGVHNIALVVMPLTSA